MNSIHPTHLVSQFRQRAEQHPENTALRYAHGDRWHEVQWRQFLEAVDQTSLALLSAGLPVQGNIGLWSLNMPEWSMALTLPVCRHVAAGNVYTPVLERVSVSGIKNDGCPLSGTCPDQVHAVRKLLQSQVVIPKSMQ